MGQRAEISVQFNWIFVTLVGALILLFFANIIYTQQKLSLSKISATVLNDIDAISSGAEVSRGTVQVISIPNLDLGFSCSETCACAYSLTGTQVAFGDKIMYAPDTIKGRRITAWTYDWSMPYRVSNMLYMTSPDARYIIVDDLNGDLAEYVNSTLPPRTMLMEGNEEIIFNKELIVPEDLPGIREKNNYKVKIIGFQDDSASSDSECQDPSSFNPTCDVPEELQGMGDAYVTAVKIVGTKDIGEAIFYKKRGSSWSNNPGEMKIVPYLGEAMLFAAIFAEDAEMYRCGAEKLIEKMTYVNNVYVERTKGLRAKAMPPPGCTPPSDCESDCVSRYTEALRILQDPGGSIKKLIDDMFRNGIGSDKFKFNQLWSFAFGTNQLDALNRLLQTTNCQELY